MLYCAVVRRFDAESSLLYVPCIKEILPCKLDCWHLYMLIESSKKLWSGWDTFVKWCDKRGGRLFINVNSHANCRNCETSACVFDRAADELVALHEALAYQFPLTTTFGRPLRYGVLWCWHWDRMASGLEDQVSQHVTLEQWSGTRALQKYYRYIESVRSRGVVKRNAGNF